ncbi:uncharacterized protein LOC130911339 isoform X2 [Corythoichthys intestinalis]|uniref:uncharacterized protein LOC130911339 isoform X2 n=1 Tax=Corythoichthys intestinalis TaxID=161448 RepID=UPI0025A51AC8|nr:uncharacterized protein LOC130911339 isoform X2 [Corythoichthys intestinalis]
MKQLAWYQHVAEQVNINPEMTDVSQAHCPALPKRQGSARIEEDEEEESPYMKKEEEVYVHIKEEQEEYFIPVENTHIEEQQKRYPLIKEEADPPYVKVEVIDVSKWTGESLKGEDAGPSQASRGAEPTSGGSSSLKEGSQADLMVQSSESDDATSHSLFSPRPSCHAPSRILPRV